MLRFNSTTIKGNRGYLDQGTDIQFHYRKEEMNTGADTLKPYSRGCLMVGIGQEDFGRFMNSVLDTHCRISVPYPFFTLGKDKNLLAGQEFFLHFLTPVMPGPGIPGEYLRRKGHAEYTERTRNGALIRPLSTS